MVKKTMAILGDTGKFSLVVMQDLMKQDLRLLFISKDETKKFELKKQLGPINGAALTEVEFTSCERDGCWEADIIAITGKENISIALIQKIKEVATQKTVLIISEENKKSGSHDLVKSLPNSNVIEIQIETPVKEFRLSGMDPNSLTEIKFIFENAGYQHKNK